MQATAPRAARLARLLGLAGSPGARRVLRAAAVAAVLLVAGLFARDWLREQRCRRMVQSDNVVERQEGLVLLGRFGGRGALPLLERLAKDPAADAQTRRLAVAALGDVGASASFDVLASLLDDPDPGLVEAAAVALGRLRDGRAVGPLVRVAREKRARLAVLWSLGAIGDERAVPLLDLEAADPDVYVAYNARQALKRIAGR